jgi:hypothetical protein
MPRRGRPRAPVRGKPKGNFAVAVAAGLRCVMHVCRGHLGQCVGPFSVGPNGHGSCAAAVCGLKET